MLSVSYGWDGIPGILVVAPSFKFFDAADAAKVIEKEVGMYSTYKSNYVALHESAVRFAKAQIPLVDFWL